MSKIFADHEWVGMFSAADRIRISQVYEQVCSENTIPFHAADQRDALAMAILRAAKQNLDFSELRIAALSAMKNY